MQQTPATLAAARFNGASTIPAIVLVRLPPLKGRERTAFAPVVRVKRTGALVVQIRRGAEHVERTVKAADVLLIVPERYTQAGTADWPNRSFSAVEDAVTALRHATYTANTIVAGLASALHMHRPHMRLGDIVRDIAAQLLADGQGLGSTMNADKIADAVRAYLTPQAAPVEAPTAPQDAPAAVEAVDAPAAAVEARQEAPTGPGEDDIAHGPGGRTFDVRDEMLALRGLATWAQVRASLRTHDGWFDLDDLPGVAWRAEDRRTPRAAYVEGPVDVLAAALAAHDAVIGGAA